MGQPHTVDTFLFDLDMTLVDTSALDTYRRERDWAAFRSHLHLIRPMPSRGEVPAHGLPARLRADGYTVGVVTSLPSFYAERVLERYCIPWHVLVGFHDTSLHKPHPAPLLHALAKLNADPAQSCYVGDDIIDMQAAMSAGIRAVGAGWGPTTRRELSRTAPDVYFLRPEDLLRGASALDRSAYIGEGVSHGHTDLRIHEGSILRCGLDPKAFSLGRYFVKHDPRHPDHRWSQLILSLKRDDTAAPLLANAIACFLKNTRDWSPAHIVPVPPKLGEARNRFAKLLALVQPTIPDVRVHLYALTWRINPPSDYKKLGPQDRAASVSGRLQAIESLRGKVLLVDDVLTSGSQARECVQALMEAGADQVVVLTLGRTQSVLPKTDLPCDQLPLAFAEDSD